MALNFEKFLEEFGELGPYATFVTFMMCFFACLMNGYNGFGLIFLTYTPDFQCTGSSSFSGPFPTSTSESSESFRYNNNGTHFNIGPTASQCDIQYTYRSPDTGDTVNVSEPCTTFNYSKEYFDETLITKWDLVCGRAIQSKTMISLMNGITVVGCLFYAWISDRFGRRKAFYLNVILYVFGSSVSLFMPDLTSYSVLRVFAALNSLSSWNIGYIWAIEYTGPNKRTIVTMILVFAYSLSLMTLSFMACFSRTYVQFGLLTSVPFILLLSYKWLIMESPMWLTLQGKMDEVDKVVDKMIRWEPKRKRDAKKLLWKQFKEDNEQDGKEMKENLLKTTTTTTDTNQPGQEDDSKQPQQQESKPPREAGVIDLFRVANLRRKIICLCFCFVANSIVYVSIAYNTENLPGNLYATWAISSSVEAPAMIIFLILMKKCGRIWPQMFTMTLSGIFCILTVPGEYLGTWVVLVMAFIGKFCICISYTIIYQMSGELLPTAVRSSGIGLASVVGDIGNVSMPYIIHSSTAYKMLPMIIIGVMAIMGGFLTLLLPETSGMELPQTIEDSEKTICGFVTARGHIRRLFGRRTEAAAQKTSPSAAAGKSSAQNGKGGSDEKGLSAINGNGQLTNNGQHSAQDVNSTTDDNVSTV